MSFARINGAVLHWQAHGAGPPVVFANSLGSDLRIWDALPLPGYRVVRYDLRGHGLSDAPKGAFGIDDHADDLAALIDHLGAGPCALVGLSVGGMIVQRLAARFPERARAIVLCATAARIGTPAMWAGRIEAVRHGGLAPIADAILERWFTARFRAERPDDLAGWRNMLVRTPAIAYAATCAAIRDADLAAGAAAIRAPCLCVAGAEDVSTPPELVRATAALITDARFETIAGAAHLPCIEQPDRLSALIRQHLTEAAYV